MSSWRETLRVFRHEIEHVKPANDKEIFENQLFDQIMESKTIEEVCIKKPDGSYHFLQADGSFAMATNDVHWIDSKLMDIGLYDQLLKCIAQEQVVFNQEEVKCLLFSKVKRPDEKTSMIKQLIEEARVCRWHGDYESYYDIVMTLDEMGVTQDQYYRYLEE